MSTSLVRPFGVPNHPAVTRVECDSLAGELRQQLLAVRSKDPKVIQLRKDLQQLKNKAPETIAALVSDAFNNGTPVAERFASTIRDFFSARREKLQRTIRQLNPIETKLDGELDCTQMAIADGDLSTPTLRKFVEELEEYIAVAQEMRAAAIAELYRAERR